ncbi:MAG: caspase family protein [Kiritimatiellia bacterium]
MSKRIVLSVLLSVLLGLPAFAAEARFIPGTATELPQLVTSEGKTYKLGKKPYTAGTREKWVAEGRALAKTPEGYLPTGKMLKGAADNRSYMPPIGDQGYEGSCVHWAGSYNTKTANMKRQDSSINVNAASNQGSPRFTYNLTNAGEDSGGYGHEPFEIFMRYGVASLAQKPYDDEQYTVLPTAADFIEGLHRRTTNYVWLWDWAPDAAQIAELKAWLDDGRVAACGVNAETSFDAWGPGDAPWVGATCTIDDINHMVTVCGYGTGYYLVANQWGTSFGSNGYIVVDSDYFENYFSDVMYPLEGTYEPATDYAKLTIRHTQRSDVQELLLTANGANVWSNSPLPKDMPAGDASGVFVTDTRDNLELAIDLTQVPWDAANVVTARVKDAVSGNVGTVTVFSVTYDGTEYASANVPVTVPYNSYTTAWVRLYQSTDTNVCFTSAGAAVGEGSGSYVVTVYKTQASGDVSGQVVLSGTATEGAGADYTVSGTNFALNGATTSATFTVTLNDDADEEGAETVVLTLANVAGGIVQAPDVFTLTINPSDLTGGSVLISQYTETDGGTTPKGIEIWNASASDLTFDSGANLLDVKVGMNAAVPASVLTVSSGTLAAGDVWVIGTSDMSPDIEEPFSFNGDDSIVLELGGVVQDMIGVAGSDPGSEWSGGGVSTANQNIQLILGTTFGDPDGWTDPSERFEYVDVGSTLTGFGEPPGGWTDVPPVLAPIGNKSAVWSNNLSFGVTAADAADGDSIVLSASNLPAGATFATVTNAGTVSNTFVWNNVGPMGVYNVTFTATDKDGSDSETVAITIGDGSGPSEIVFQGFESTPADTWGITAGNYILNTAGTADTPANQRVRTGSYSWQPGETDELSETLELANVDVSAYSDVVATLHLSATCTNYADGYGMWPSDSMSVYLGLDGGDYSANPDIKVTGNQVEADGIVGALWSYAAAGVAATTAGVPRTVAPAAGGIAADGMATVQIALPPGTTAVKLKAVSALEAYGYFWNVDDVSLEGVADGGAADYPPVIAVDPDQTEITAPISNAVTFAITGREVPNDAADTVRLWATGLPAGATFPEISGASVLTNVFNWTPTVTGTTVVSFFAGDKDGTNQVDVTIEVFEQIPPGTYRAVICGISDYEGTDNDLNYCDDDAQEMYDRLLSGSNWSADNVQLLLDAQATEANIQAAIAAMGAASVPGDVNLFFFSGHGGGDMPDADGDEGGDGYDEYMCPYNLTTDEITDDELSAWLDALPTDNLIVLLDTCFSGGHLKAPVGLTYKGVSRTGAIVTNRTNGFVDDLRKKTKRDVDDLTSPYIATACDETELSAEDSGIENGVFAYYLLEALTNSDVNVDGWAAGEEAYDYLYPLAVAYNSEQHPQEYDGWPGLANIVTWAPLADQPPTIALDPAGTNKTAIIDAALSFTVTATDADGLAVSLTASGLPSGATAPDANGTGTASTTFNWTPTAAQTGVYHVAFSATDDDGTTVRGVQITVRDGSMAADLFISEYIEGSSNNKAVEIFNGTGAAIDLGTGGYVLRLYANGSTTPSSITLAGTVADGDVFVVANSGANATILAQTDQTSGSLTHNGNDVVALAKNDANIDVVGTIGSDATFAAEVTKVRKSTVVEGTTTYDPLEWDDYAADTTEYLGSHEFGAAEPSAPSFAAIPAQNATVGALFSLDADSYASGNPAPAVTLESSTADAGDYSFAAGTLSFTPSVAGEFEFVFLASNELGTAMATATVTAVEGPVELLAPVIQAASAIDATQFNANWLASAGATGYVLDVGTNETFSGGDEPVGGNLMVNAGFELGTSNNWTKFEPEYTVATTDPQEGTYHVSCAATATRDIMQTVEITGDGLSPYEISYYYQVLAGDGTDVRIWSTWASGGQVSGDTLTSATYNATADVWTKQTYTVVPAAGANTLNFEVRVYNGATVYLDNFFVGVTPAGRRGASYVPGYANLDVGNATTFAVTGLTEGVTYYYRAKAYTASSNSPYSAVTSVVTQASSGEQPNIAFFEVPAGAAAAATLTTSAVGKTYKLQYTTDLTTQPEPIWTDADSEPGTGGELLLVDETPTDMNRYYRVTVQ